MFDGKYLDWNQKRIKGILDFYGHKFLHLKKVLDLGCGYGDISGVFYRLGSDVTAVDARQEHLKVVNKKYPGIKIIKSDLDREWLFHDKPVDVILNLDLINHLENYETHLRNVCNSTEFLILETAVCDSNDPYKNIFVSQDRSIYDLSINGTGSMPSAANIERILTECNMSFKRQDNSKYNCASYVYDWQSQNNDECDFNKRRLWFAEKLFNKNKVAAPKAVITPGLAPPVLTNTHIPVNSQINIKLPHINTEPKIKTALCISGHLRTFEENYSGLYRNILSKLDCDVFIHTWDIIGLAYRPTDSKVKNISTNSVLNRINKLYNPKKIIIEPSKTFTVSNIIKHRQIDFRDVSGILSMFYKIEACNNLKKEYEKENNMIYDCVIRFRSDINMESSLSINKYSNLNSLYVPVYGNFGGLCDQIAYGSSPIMDTYSSLYSNINKYMGLGAPMHPERLFKYHIDYCKIPIVKVNMNFTIKRSNGLIQNNQLLERALGFLR